MKENHMEKMMYMKLAIGSLHGGYQTSCMTLSTSYLGNFVTIAY